MNKEKDFSELEMLETRQLQPQMRQDFLPRIRNPKFRHIAAKVDRLVVSERIGIAASVIGARLNVKLGWAPFEAEAIP